MLLMQLRSRRAIFSLLALLGLISTVSIVFTFLWMTTQINRAETFKSSELLALSLRKEADLLRFATEDYAHWGHAFEIIQQNDSDAIFDDIGSGATDSELFDSLFILGPDGTVLYAYDEDLFDAAYDLWQPDTFAGIWQELNAHAAWDYETVTAVVENGGSYALVAATWVAPDVANALPAGSFPAIFGLRRLDADWLAGLARQSRVTMTAISPLEDGDPPPEIALRDAAGVPIAALQWQSSMPGSDLRRTMAPFVALICAAVLGICALAAGFFQSQHHLLARARKVASTDQLTGLNNRAGLDEILSTKRVKDAIALGEFAVMFLDLNDFKKLNDAHGHKAGDIALKVTAERLSSVVRGTDFVGRMGGDEFIMLILDKNPEAVSVTIADRIIAMSKAPIAFPEHAQVIMPAVGISVATPGMQWETLLSQSDAAMYWSKKKKAQQPILFSRTMDTQYAAA